MESTGLMVGLGLIAAAFAVIAFVRYRTQESATLKTGAELARELRSLAGDDPVRHAAVDEYEVALYQRLFYASVVAPRIRGAAWALLGAALSAFAVLAVRTVDGLTADVISISFIVVTIVFALAALVLAGLALYQSATTPRVSFADSYGS